MKLLWGIETMNKNYSERVAKWDNAKFLLILLVVIGHFVDLYTKNSASAKSLFLFIYLFHMPAFIFLAGLFGKRTVREKRYDKILGYFVLFAVMKIFIYMTRILLGQSPSFKILSESGVPWFIFAIAIFYLITIGLRDYKPQYVLTVSICLACFVGYDNAIGDFLCLSRVIVFYPFFYLGYSLTADEILILAKRVEVRMLSIIFLCVLATLSIVYIDQLYWLRPLFTGRNPFEKLLYFSEYGCFLRLGWYLASGLTVLAFLAVVPERRTFFTALGSRTIQVYALHRPVIYIWQVYNIDSFMVAIWPTHWKILTLTFSVLLTFLLSTKIFSKPFNWIMNPLVKMS